MGDPPPRPRKPALTPPARVKLRLKDGRYLIAFSRRVPRKPNA